MALFLPKLDKTMPIVTVRWVDPTTGKNMVADGTSSSRFQIFWQFQSVKIDSAAGGGTFSQEAASDEYDPAQMQRVIDALASLYRGLS